ncbi:MAG TPA: hypothetical protein VFD19_04435, partial [Clostridia bacterium]|nr:hypothetical protein [Clostridia bacterium]
VKDTTLRRWSKEYEELTDRTFPGNGSPKLSKDYEIVKIKKRRLRVEKKESQSWQAVSPWRHGHLPLRTRDPLKSPKELSGLLIHHTRDAPFRRP